jgi:hypothetical protein
MWSCTAAKTTCSDFVSCPWKSAFERGHSGGGAHGGGREVAVEGTVRAWPVEAREEPEHELARGGKVVRRPLVVGQVVGQRVGRELLGEEIGFAIEDVQYGPVRLCGLT